MVKKHFKLNIFFLTFLILVITYGVIIFPVVKNRLIFLSQSPCERPISYSVDRIDPEFNMTKEQFIQYLQQSVTPWNEARHQELFLLQDGGELKISLLYDGRQSLRQQLTDINSRIESERTSLDEKKAEYDRLYAQFQIDLANFNQQVDYWNTQGGAPDNVYYQLLNRQQELESDAVTIDNLASELNITVDKYNTEVGELNETADDYNHTINERPEEGIYRPDEHKIEIYFYVDETEFKHTLIHEFGHALTLDHLEDDPTAIMYPYVTKITDLNENDLRILNEYCEQKTYEIMGKEILANLKEDYSQEYQYLEMIIDRIL